MGRFASSAMVIASQILAAAANQVVKVLETDDDPVNPFQILFVRMLITGLAYSITYLSLSQATAVNFLAPMCATILSEYIARGTLAIINVAGAILALVGVVLVVQPIQIFDTGYHIADNEQIQDFHEKWKGVMPALVGVVGSTVSPPYPDGLYRYVKAATDTLAPLEIDCTRYFVITTITLVMVGQIPWPTSFTAWALMSVVGVLGGLMVSSITLRPSIIGGDLILCTGAFVHSWPIRKFIICGDSVGLLAGNMGTGI
ncbi:integral membrane protein DUF6 [Diaporthe helianthi]|uniref:Integral membrane protein DUF6 n=1 Tax=Diaporthe helianthi TaxID=158607 RepID=A0A2P5HQF1_DIAHE|nr:integral membrane protein DUF6 [Diaporthe helianthi]